MRASSGVVKMRFRELCSRSVLTAAITAVLCAFSAQVQAQNVTVVEYHHKVLDAYFVTGRADEQAGLDGIAVFQRTGMTFQATAVAGANANQAKICRFYIGLTNPFVSSHFYGLQGPDCEGIRAQNVPGFNWEDYDFATQKASGGVCPAGTVGIYRGFRSVANGKTSNHRYSASLATYNAAVTAGYDGEGIAFCATSATAASSVITPPSSGSDDCGVYFASNKALTIQSTSTTAGSTSPATTFVRTYNATPMTFLGRTVTQVVDTSPGSTSSTMIEDNGATYSEIGARGVSGGVTNETYYAPPIVYPKAISIGQRIDFARTITFNPASPNGTGNQTGSITLVSRESVTVPAGTFTACKFATDQLTQYPSVGSNSHTTTTSWIAPGLGLLRADIADATTVAGFSINSTSQLLTTQVQ